MRNTKGAFRGLLFSSAAALSLITLAAPAAAQDRSYSIKPTTLSKALREYGRQSGRQIIFTEDLVRDKQSPALNGTYSPDAALAKLLEGSGLKVTRAAGGALMIESAEKNGFAGVTGDPASENAGTSNGGDAVAGGQEGVAEILVVGSRSQNVDIRRTEDDSQPYLVLDSKLIESVEASSLEELLRKLVPMNATNTSAAQNSEQSASNLSSIDLRGLGSNQTLILIDGRRVARALPDGGAEFTQSDINGIPISAIDRIEILPSTAGGIYGGGAVGGVINVIRKRRYNSIDLIGSLGGAMSGGAETIRVEANGGLSVDGNTQLSFSASFRETNPLYAEENGLWRRARRLFVQNDPSATSFPGYLPNIRSVNGANLTFDNGTPLNSNHNFIPEGYVGVQSDQGAALRENAGNYSFELSNDVRGRRATL